jgi:haloalkane dehalogenase
MRKPAMVRLPCIERGRGREQRTVTFNDVYFRVKTGDDPGRQNRWHGKRVDGVAADLVCGPGSYRFVEHRRYLDALLQALEVRERVTFVLHNWGSALGFDWANRHREAVKGIAFMEAIVAPQGRDHWDKMGMRSALEALRSEAGEAMVLQNNYFIEEILPNAIMRKLSEEEMAEYRRPFTEPGEGRRPTLTWPRQIPIEGEPPDVTAIAAAYADWLAASDVPKLFLKVEPGAILANDTLINLVRAWPALTQKTVARIHFVQEDSSHEIGRAIVGWIRALA